MEHATRKRMVTDACRDVETGPSHVSEPMTTLVGAALSELPSLLAVLVGDNSAHTGHQSSRLLCSSVP